MLIEAKKESKVHGEVLRRTSRMFSGIKFCLHPARWTEPYLHFRQSSSTCDFLGIFKNACSCFPTGPKQKDQA